MISRWGHLVARRAARTLLLALLLLAGAGAYGSGVFDSLSGGGFDDPASESARQLDRERALFGNRGADVVVVYSHDDLVATDPAFEDEVRSLVAGLPEGAVSSVTSWYDTKAPGMLGDDGHAVQVVIALAGDDQDEMGRNYDAAAPALESDLLTTEVAGTWAVYDDVNDITAEDLKRAELFSLPIVLLLSLLIFGSVVAALMPVMVGAAAVVGALAVVRLITLVTEVSVFSVNVITLLGMGLAIDYALFVVSRYREELARLPVEDPDAPARAIAATMATAGRTVLFSGLTVAAAMSSLLVFPQGFLRSLGYGGIAAVLVGMLAALTILPAVLRLLGRRVDAGRLPWRRHRSVGLEPTHGAWSRIAHAVMRRPVVVMAVVTGALLASAAPFLGVTWGSVDYRVLPEDAPSYVAAERLNDTFGPERSTANLLVTGADPAELAGYTEDVRAVPEVRSVEPVAREDGGATLLVAAWEGNAQTPASQDVVRAIREVPVPDGARVLVGGNTADTVDMLESVGARLPWMAAIVVGVMLVLLFLAFGSLVLPVKAVLMNVLSLGASFGVVTWIFADGNLEGLLGFTSPGFLDATQPILMLAILFGLSMDYEVFLLSRVREEWDRTGDNTRAVAVGVQRTGRIITSAALLLAVVIGAFGTSGIVFMKMIGIGMLVALLLDATVVRALLVPATMKLLGSANWWAPGPLRRWWERHGLRETDGAPAPAAAATAPAPVGTGG